VLLPFGDYPNPPKPQWVTRILIGINVAVFLLVNLPLGTQKLSSEEIREEQETLRDMFVRSNPAHEGTPGQIEEFANRHVTKLDVVIEKYGYRPGKPSVLALLLCMFLHSGWMHLIGNMLYLFIYGDNVEYRLGPIPYLIAYLGTGAVATISFAMANAGSVVPLVGASGAISGVLGFYLIWFPYNYVRVFLWIFVFVQVIHVRAIVVLLIYLFLDNLLPYLASRGAGGGGGVAHLAHLGGFGAGVAAAWLFNRAKGQVAPPRPSAGDPVGGGARGVRGAMPQVQVKNTRDPARDFAWAVENSEMSQAAHAFAAIAREGGAPPEPSHVFLLASWLYERGYVNDAIAVFQYFLKNFARHDDSDRAHLGLGVLYSRKLKQPANARHHLEQAIRIATEQQDQPIRETAEAELRRLEGGGDSAPARSFE